MIRLPPLAVANRDLLTRSIDYFSWFEKQVEIRYGLGILVKLREKMRMKALVRELT